MELVDLSETPIARIEAQGVVTDSWIFGHHNPGSDLGRSLIFTEGVPAYRKIFADIAASDYDGFDMR